MDSYEEMGFTVPTYFAKETMRYLLSNLERNLKWMEDMLARDIARDYQGLWLLRP